jgi:hypothetical protein
MRSGKYIAEQLAKLQGPPSPREMRGLVDAMVRDGDLRRASIVAGEMVSWAHLAPGDEDFYYWFGVRQTLSGLAAGDYERWRARVDMRERRQQLRNIAAERRRGVVS